MMPLRQLVFALIVSIGLLLLIVDLVRRRSLREEYALLWLLTGFGVLVLTVRFNWLVWLTRLIGADEPMSTLFFFGVFFAMLVSLHYATRISRLTEQVKDLSQALALTQARLDASQQQSKGES